MIPSPSNGGAERWKDVVELVLLVTTLKKKLKRMKKKGNLVIFTSFKSVLTQVKKY